MRNKARIIIPLIVIQLLVLACALSQCDTWLFLSLLLFMLIVYRYSFQLTKNVFFLFFLVCFFTFMMSAQVAKVFFGYDMQYVNTPEDFSFLNKCVFLSLLFITIGYAIGQYVGFKSLFRRKASGISIKRREYGYVSKYVFYLFAIPWYIVLIEQCIVVQTAKYVDLYTFESTLPGLITQLGEACPIAFCLFLATFPSKKEARIPIAIVMVYSIVSLLNGRRLFFVSYTFLIVAYMLIRTYKNGGKEQWITKRQIFLLIALVPAVIIFLYSYKYIRYDRAIEATSLTDAFIGFFAQQGFSANLIVTAKHHAARMTDDIYSFYGTIRFLRLNVFSKYILGLDYSDFYFGNRTDQALLSGSFSRMMSYILIPGKYSRGYGVGSCYIAELYHDFGYFGICFGNLIYGYVIGRVLKLDESKTLKNTVALLMFLQFLSVSRYNYDKVFSMFISFNFWAVILIAYIGVEIIGVRNKDLRKFDDMSEGDPRENCYCDIS